MNRDLIKKYKAEFDHWLNGGKILYASYDLDEKNYSAWYELHHDCKWDYNNAYRFKFIINDEYVEFRKALAEGKIVQYNFGNYGINRKDFPNTWKDLDLSIGILADRACPENYRIKQEEPKFRVGDWLVEIYSGDFAKVLNIYKKDIRVHLLKSNSIITTESTDFIHWQPKKGEWCWWFSTKNRVPTIGQFLTIETDGNRKYSATFPNTPHPSIAYYDYCEPFLGTLPTKLQLGN